jgi:enoyl-CoA hydratase
MTTVLSDRDGAVVTLTLNRPEKLNALNAELLAALAAALTSLDDDPTVRAVVLTGAGDKAFVAGADIGAMAAMSPAEALAFADRGRRAGDLLEGAHFPVIAAVNGFALGGGCELALCCDFIYASDRARFGQPEVGLGIIPGFGGTQRLARAVGRPRARELCMTGDPLSAEEARAIGLVNAVVPHADLLPKVRAVAEKIAGRGPLAVTAVKRAIRRGDDGPLATGNELEASAFAALFGSADQKEGMRAFLEKRAAVFTGK